MRVGCAYLAAACFGLVLLACPASAQQSATATGKGVAINAKDNAKVTVYSRDPADQARIKELESQLGKLPATLQEQYRQGFLDAQKLAEKPNASAADKAAFKDLQAGKPEKATQSAAEQERLAANAAKANHAEAAKWARHLAVFEQISKPDSRAALDAAARAVQYEPDNSENHLLLGDAQVRVGESAGALRSYQAMQRLVLGQIKSSPANTQWQRDLSISYERIGDLQNAEGKRPEALKSYQDGLEITKRLAALDKANSEWQTDLVVSAWKMSALAPDVLSRADAAASLREALQILTKLKAAGALRADQQGWGALIQTRLDNLK
jgi:hypothetical protein